MAEKQQKGLDPQAAALLKQMAQLKMPELHTLTPKAARDMMDAGIKMIAGKPEKVSKVEDLKIPGPAGQIPVRVYTPEGKGPFPVFVYYHGGGFVIGNVPQSDNFCRGVANRAACVVVSVEYRLAPEHKYPAAVDDSYTTTKWVSKNADRINGDPHRIAVGGDSAGGNLAAVVSLKARDEGEKFPIYQVLIYPATDLTGTSTVSRNEFAEGYFLTKADMLWFGEQYFKKGQDPRVPYASPLLAPDVDKLPPALIITAGFDPLRDEGEAYGERLKKAGVPAKVSRYAGMIHGFTSMDGAIDKAKEAMNEVAASLSEAFKRGKIQKKK
ncbi:MAG: alpha/beta hydrolase [Promethearchaeati archaeon SRVP18_Atabeyarchaeia-1]